MMRDVTHLTVLTNKLKYTRSFLSEDLLQQVISRMKTQAVLDILCAIQFIRTHSSYCLCLMQLFY